MHSAIFSASPISAAALLVLALILQSNPARADVLAVPALRGIVLPEKGGSATDTVTVTNDNPFPVTLIDSHPTVIDISDFDDVITPPTVPLDGDVCGRSVLILAGATCTFDITFGTNNLNTGDVEGGTLTIMDEITVRRPFGPFLPSTFLFIEVGILDPQTMPEPWSVLLLGVGVVALVVSTRMTAPQPS